MLIYIVFLVIGINISWGVDVPPTSGPLDVQFTLNSAVGQGSNMVGKFDLTNGLGVIEYNSMNYAVVSFVYDYWDSTEYSIFFLLAVADDKSDVAVFYLYSNWTTSEIAFIEYESYNVQVTKEEASGTVSFGQEAGTIDVKLPGLNVLPSPIATGLTINGSGITLQNDHGKLSWNKQHFDIIPFNVVYCPSCENVGWYAIQCMLVPSKKEACFGILYLLLNDHDSVDLDHGLCLPDRTSPSWLFTANWKTTSDKILST